MDVIPLIYVPTALLAGVVFHHLVFGTRVQSSQTPGWPRRLAASVVPLVCLLFWVALCYVFKALTWKPFAGDTPGSVGLTNLMLLAGSAVIGVWISARLRSRK